jgi:tubulin-specific chaperone A
MGPPSQLAIATGVVNRLVKEEKSYHQEAEEQKGRIAKLEQGDSSDENHEFTLRQEVSFQLCLDIFVVCLHKLPATS